MGYKEFFKIYYNANKASAKWPLPFFFFLRKWKTVSGSNARE